MIAYKIPIVFCFALSRALPITKCTLSRRLSPSRDCNVCPVDKNFLDVSSDGGSGSGFSWPVVFVVAFSVCLRLAALAREYPLCIPHHQVPIPLPIPEFSTHAFTCPWLPALLFCAWTRLHFTCAL